MPFDNQADIRPIGDVAAEYDVSTRTLRYYESIGLLKPRRVNGIRCFTKKDCVHLTLILRGKRLGFSLQESQELIRLYDKESGNQKQLKTMLGLIAEKRAELEQQKVDIEVTLAELADNENRCRKALNKQK